MDLARLRPRDGRFLAVVILLIVLLLFYLIAVHWWFVAPEMQLGTQMQDLRDQQLHFRQAAAQKPEIEKRLAEIRAHEQNNQAFLSDTDESAASAWLIQRLNQAIADHAKDEKRCSSVSQSKYTGPSEELYKSVTVTARMRCDLEPLAAILYDLENGKPYLFVDQIMIYKQQTYRPPGRAKSAESPLDVRFNLTGYLRTPAKAAAGKAAK